MEWLKMPRFSDDACFVQFCWAVDNPPTGQDWCRVNFCATVSCIIQY